MLVTYNSDFWCCKNTFKGYLITNQSKFDLAPINTASKLKMIKVCIRELLYNIIFPIGTYYIPILFWNIKQLYKRKLL